MLEARGVRVGLDARGLGSGGLMDVWDLESSFLAVDVEAVAGAMAGMVARCVLGVVCVGMVSFCMQITCACAALVTFAQVPAGVGGGIVCPLHPLQRVRHVRLRQRGGPNSPHAVHVGCWCCAGDGACRGERAGCAWFSGGLPLDTPQADGPGIGSPLCLCACVCACRRESTSLPARPTLAACIHSYATGWATTRRRPRQTSVTSW